MKTSNNNITFSGMSIYRKVGDLLDVYIPEAEGLLLPPSGYDGFGPLLINAD